MRRKIILAAVLVAALAQPVLADERLEALAASYGLRGMMEGAVTFCAEVLRGDLTIHLVNLDWVARNTPVMDELEATREQFGEPQYRTIDWVADGREGITAILQQAANPEEACTNWKAETEAGGYDAETFLAEQLGMLRERDGL